MKPFDPGGAAYTLADVQPMAGESGLVQRCARRDFFCPRGLKGCICLEDAEKRVLHCTHGATLYFTGRTTPFSASQGVLGNGQTFQAPSNTGGFIYPRRKIDASNGSLETVADTTEGQDHAPADCSPKLDGNLKEIVGCSNAQQEENKSSHISTRFDESLVLINHLGAFSSSSQNTCHSMSLKLTSRQALQIPRASAVHISCDEVWQAHGFCIEDPEALSTADLQSEVRTLDYEAFCFMGVDRLFPSDDLCPGDANGLVLLEKTCKKDADNIFRAHEFPFKEEDSMSTCMVQCSAGEDYSSALELLYKYSSSSLCENRKSAKGQISSRKLKPSACRQYVAQQLSACLMVSVSPAACGEKLPEYKHAHVMLAKYADRIGRRQNSGTKIIAQEEMRARLWIFSQRYLPPMSGSNFLPRCLDLEQCIVGSCKLEQCSSKSPSKVSIVSASDYPNLPDAGNERLPQRTWGVRELMPEVEEYLAEPYGYLSWVQENGSIKIIKALGERNGIPNEHLEACCSQLHAPSAPHINYSHGDIFDRGCKSFLALCTRDSRDKANALPYAVDGPCSPTSSLCSWSSEMSVEGSKSSMLHGEVQERRSRMRLEQFAEIFLLRRHIKLQQQRAQQAPPYPCRESAGLVADAKSPRSVSVEKRSPHTCSFTDASMDRSVSLSHEPAMILTLSLTKRCDVSSHFCDDGICAGTDVIIDIVGLAKHIEKHSSKLETFTDAALKSISRAHLPFRGGQLVMSNVNAMIVAIVAIMVYTKILLDGVLSWVGPRTRSKEKM